MHNGVKTGILFGLVAVGIAGIAAAYFLMRPKAIVVADRLCDYVQGQQLNCVTTLAADTFVHPGSIISYQPSQTPASDQLPLPVSDITGTSCLVPGTREFTDAAKAPSPVSIPQLSYEVNGALKIGADVELPQLYGTTIKAGPEWSDVQRVDFAVDEAWITQIDENLAINAVQSCSIRKQCVDRIKSQQYRVVATALVAKGLNYKFYDKSGAVISLSGAANANMFSASLGGSSNVQATTDATIKATDPRVVGVRLLPVDVFAGQPVCESNVIFRADGSASVSIGGGGGKGQIGAVQTQRKPINETAQLAATGTESSECDNGFERKVSGAQATASVAATADGKIRLSYDIAAHGGHYVTVAGCVLGQVVGKTGHDNSASASADLIGTISVITRSENSPVLRVTWQNMPKTGGEIRVLDWNNEPLRDSKSEQIVGPITAAGDGGQDLQSRGPGLYHVETRIQLSSSVGGNDDKTQQQSADVTADVVGATN
ncbi:hypothetical protein NKJ40_26525 [Mesorhizobium sp. M0119]|uniref:hypothetical protein n=1 Tax=Mesorhizobium sp. M0119 TaxID=2956885 RepID=UPI0033368A69